MNKADAYYHSKVTMIPVDYLTQMVTTEIRDMMFDCGKKIAMTDPELQYVAGRVVQELRIRYQGWELQTFDSCMRSGMMDEYDKGQTITVKRLTIWMQSMDRGLRAREYYKNVENEKNVANQNNASLQQLADNGSRFPKIILFRIDHKPEYDHMTLEEIEKTPAFVAWRDAKNSRVEVNKRVGRF